MAKQKTTIILSIILVVFVIVAIVLYSQNSYLKSQIKTAHLQINGTADVFDAKLHDLLQEHTFLLINTIRRSLDSSASYNSSLVALQNNINEVGTLLTPIYGSNAQQLVDLWNTKTNIFINYSTSLKNNDPNALAYYNSAAAAYEESCAIFWASTNNPYPVFDKATMKQVVTDHVNDVKAAVDDWNAKNYPLYFSDLETAYNQAGTYADIIAQGIVQQNPQDFQ